MSKRIKPVFEDVVQTDNAHEETVVDDSSSKQETIEKAVSVQRVGPKGLSKEMIQKLEQYDSIVEQNKVLLKEKAELTDKISEYIAEVNELKSKIQDSQDAKEIEAENIKLKNENRELQKSYDQSLVKISELSFENSKLICQMSELGSKLECNTPDVSGTKIQKPEQPVVRRDPYNPYKNNGYSQWN